MIGKCAQRQTNYCYHRIISGMGLYIGRIDQIFRSEFRTTTKNCFTQLMTRNHTKARAKTYSKPSFSGRGSMRCSVDSQTVLGAKQTIFLMSAKSVCVCVIRLYTDRRMNRMRDCEIVLDIYSVCCGEFVS